MSDEPRFPSPEEGRPGGAYRSGAQVPVAAPTGRTVVTRPDPPVDDGAKAPTKLTAEELSALLAVDGVNRPTMAQAFWRRGRVVVIPTGLISLLAELFLGDAAPWVIAALFVFSIAYAARPLFTRSGWA